MATPHANVVFFPWVRQGAAAGINTVDTLSAAQRGTASLTAGLAINTLAPVQVTVRLRGPADAIGIDPHEIVRVDPRPDTADFEPNYFASIEFDRPDFPWLFTPARADVSGRLRPWLCLVVVREQRGVTLRSTSDAPLPVLEIAAPARPVEELPDLSESWLWAHSQAASAASASATDLRTTLATRPELSLSRLLCPRLLEPNTDYIACVVPTFDLGRKAGLGEAITETELTSNNGLKPAWSLSPSPSLVTLPVYHHWRFRTGEDGDFESLVRILKPRPAPSGLGKRTVNIGQPGFALPETFPSDATLEFEGALRPIDDNASTPWPEGTAEPFQAELADIVNAPGTAEAIDPQADPLLAPPLYGRWHAARATVTPGSTTWLDELNLDPRHRSVAALGSRVVQDHQEALMAAAWEQAADLQGANQRMRQLQLSLAVNVSVHKRHLMALDDEAVLRVGAPAFSRLRSAAAGNPAGKTLVASLEASPLPPKATSAAMRRIGRERGPITRRVGIQGGSRSATTTWVARLNTDGGEFVAQPWVDLAAFDVVLDRLNLPSFPPPFNIVLISVYGGKNWFSVTNMYGRPEFRIVPEGQPVPVAGDARTPRAFDHPQAATFRQVASRHLSYVKPERQATIPLPSPPLEIPQVSQSVIAQIEPTRTLTALARAVVSTGANATQPANALLPTAAPIDTIMAAPKFHQPMYAPLRDLSQELLLPGLDTVLPNSVLGLTTNRRFVEAYMAGLNFEMGRELLWRGFPTDQRGTCFDQFWDTRGSAVPRADVRPMHEWGTGRLGDAPASPESDQFVLLLRSDLLRRYPTAVIYMTKAVELDGVRTPSTDPNHEVRPSFRGALPPDVSFFGFDLSVKAVVGDADAASQRGTADEGYFIVIQEQPSEPRFGLDVDTPVGDATHLRKGEGPPAGMPLNGLEWGRNAAHMAGITRQQPVRIAIHASQLVPQPSTGDPVS